MLPQGPVSHKSEDIVVTEEKVADLLNKHFIRASNLFENHVPRQYINKTRHIKKRCPLIQDECENRFDLLNIIVYLSTVVKWIGFWALIWCYYSKSLGQSVSQSCILIFTSDTQTSRASGSTKCRHYAALLTKLKVWWNNFLMFNRGLDYRS